MEDSNLNLRKEILEKRLTEIAKQNGNDHSLHEDKIMSFAGCLQVQKFERIIKVSNYVSPGKFTT